MNAMNLRTQQKEASLDKILEAASNRIRAEGLEGAAIAKIMKDAGLTHGGFYAHFKNKDELTAASLQHALTDNRRRWVGEPRDESWAGRLTRLAKRYINAFHRDNPKHGCALATSASEAGRSSPFLKQTFEQELNKSLQAICGEDSSQQHREDAMAFMALSIGAINLARAVEDKALSDQILDACIGAASRITDKG